MTLLVDGSAWFVLAVIVAAGATFALRPPDTSRALSRFYGCVIGMMGTGHVVAVTYLGTERWSLYLIGAAVALPGWALAIAARRATARQLLWLNAVPGTVTIAFVTSAALAAPAMFNLAYLRWPRRGLVIASVVAYTAMLVAAFILLLR